MKKVIIAGGTGFIGSYLTSRFLENGYNVMVVSRESNHVQWNENELSNVFEKAELVINLAGKSINCQHTAKNREAIINSRIETTTIIGNAIRKCQIPPGLWINASATGIYPPSIDISMTEGSLVGTDFLAEVVKIWEKTFFDFRLSNTRQIALRTSVVLGKNGGALQPLVKLTGFGLGGKQASGKQMMSWIHLEDYFRILLFLMENCELSGVVNCTSAKPISNKDFMTMLRQTLNISVGIPAPGIGIKIAAKLIGTEPELILNSSNVLPQCLTAAGFEFNFPDIESALTDILN